MAFAFPAYHHPDFDQPSLKNAPDARWETVEKDGVAPEEFHSTSMYPEYFKINGRWNLAEERRMDSCVVLEDDGHLSVVESRNLKKGQRVILGRTEHGQDGIYMHCNGFTQDSETLEDQFVFRQGRSRETSYAKDYDRLVELLRHEKDHGNIVWVMGPAFAFDDGARKAMQALIDNGYCHALFAGNALATHDMEGDVFHTGLGQDIYTKEVTYNGHYNHLHVINLVRKAGSVKNFIEQNNISTGIMSALVRNKVPFVLAGSIRDDGPLPDVIPNVYEAQDAMRAHTCEATTVIALATQLHTIATGNMTPSYQVVGGKVRPVYFYVVDISEFAVNKLKDRGSLSATGVVTNIQDFIVNTKRNLIDGGEANG